MDDSITEELNYLRENQSALLHRLQATERHLEDAISMLNEKWRKETDRLHQQLAAASGAGAPCGDLTQLEARVSRLETSLHQALSVLRRQAEALQAQSRLALQALSRLEASRNSTQSYYLPPLTRSSQWGTVLMNDKGKPCA